MESFTKIPTKFYSQTANRPTCQVISNSDWIKSSVANGTGTLCRLLWHEVAVAQPHSPGQNPILPQGHDPPSVCLMPNTEAVDTIFTWLEIEPYLPSGESQANSLTTRSLIMWCQIKYVLYVSLIRILCCPPLYLTSNRFDWSYRMHSLSASEQNTAGSVLIADQYLTYGVHYTTKLQQEITERKPGYWSIHRIHLCVL